ncbi:MAG: DUF3148 domain-containing protein [Synechococcaceae cyanobacterium RL_1_2]|nr:DUF3148 domain-containing protein [Synechococcaceae cyanobacterium RL_1_2]
MAQFKTGDRVVVTSFPPFLKTAEPMPMLRPPDLVKVGEEGIVMEGHPKDYWAVKFNRGVFLIDQQYLTKVEVDSNQTVEGNG